MRKEKELISLLSKLIKVIAEEAETNLAFAEKLQGLLHRQPTKDLFTKDSKKVAKVPLPDIYTELKLRGDVGFRVWLRDQPISILQALIRQEDIDPSRRTLKWKDAEKISDFIVDAILLRQTRGSAFIGRVENKS